MKLFKKPGIRILRASFNVQSFFKLTEKRGGTTTRKNFHVEIAEREHTGVVVNVKEGHLVVLFSQNEENCVEKVHDFQEVEKVGDFDNNIALTVSDIFRFRDAEEIEVVLIERFGDGLEFKKCNFFFGYEGTCHTM